MGHTSARWLILQYMKNISSTYTLWGCGDWLVMAEIPQFLEHFPRHSFLSPGHCPAPFPPAALRAGCACWTDANYLAEKAQGKVRFASSFHWGNGILLAWPWVRGGVICCAPTTGAGAFWPAWGSSVQLRPAPTAAACICLHVEGDWKYVSFQS